MAFPIVRRENRVIFVLHANEDGSLLNSISDEDCSLVDWILVDSAKGGRYSFYYKIQKWLNSLSMLYYVFSLNINTGYKHFL